MKPAWVICACILSFVGLMACQPPTGLNPGSDGTQAQSLPPTTPEGTDVASETPVDATAQRMVALASEHLANRLGATVDQIALLGATPVQWRDASLGCPRPGVDYIQRETPGYNISLELGGNVYEYHTNQVNRVILCQTR